MILKLKINFDENTFVQYIFSHFHYEFALHIHYIDVLQEQFALIHLLKDINHRLKYYEIIQRDINNKTSCNA